MKKLELILLISCSYSILKCTENISVKPFHYLLQQQINDDLQDFQIIPEEFYIKRNNKSPEPDTLFMVYMAADNNLHYFAWNNIKQMATIGSNQHVRIVIQLNEPGAHKKPNATHRKNKAIYLINTSAAGKKSTQAT